MHTQGFPRLDPDTIVGTRDGREPMRDDEHGAVLQQARDSFLHHPLGFGIQRRCGLIENQEWRILQQHTC